MDNWQPIDTATCDGTEILATDYDAIDIISFDHGNDGWFNRNGDWFFPALWQPLPAQPELTP